MKTKNILLAPMKYGVCNFVRTACILTSAICHITSSISFAQAPQAFKYQSIVRNAAGNPMASSNITVRATVHDGSATGAIVYQETQAVTTNQFGLINLEIGNGLVVSGTFSSINWGSASKWMQIEADFGSGYVPMGTSQLLSVPYALYAGNGALNNWSLSGNSGTNPSTNFIGTTDAKDFVFKTNNTEQMRILSGGNVGIGTTNPAALLHLQSSSVVDIPRGDIILARYWASNTDTRASSIFHYYNSATATDRLAFAVSGDGGTFFGQPNQVSQIKMVITAAGNVGIGTTGPGRKLEVSGSVAGGDFIGIRVSNTDIQSLSNTATIEFSTAGGGVVVPKGKIDARSINLGNYGARLGLYTANAATGVMEENVSIQSGGNVGIGVTNPTISKLEVNGTVTATGLTFSNKAFDMTNVNASTINAQAGGFIVNNALTTYTVTNSYAASNSIVMLSFYTNPGATGRGYYITYNTGNFVVQFTDASGNPEAPANGTWVRFLIVN